ncbi:MAG: glycosyltransferase, partial [Candidatus Dojkabacteria bacterium]
MRILQITSDYLPRPLWGMGWHVNQIINGLSDASDYEVYVATAYKSNNVHPNIISTESVKDALLLSDNDYEIFNDFDKFNKWQIVLAEKVLSSNIEFDIVHAHNWMSWLTAKEIKKQKPSVKLYITFHLLQKQYELMKDNPIPSHHNEIIDIENDAIESMDGIIALSDSTIKLLESHYNVSKKKVHHIPHSINFVLREFSELERIKEE